MTRHIAVVTPVLDDWACFSALVTEISNRYTGTDLIFHIYGADDGSMESLDAKGIALPPDSCVAAIEILHLALNLGHQRAIAVGLCAIADRAHFDAVLVMDSDGEDRPIDIAVLLAASLKHPAHVVLARRAKRSESLAFRFWYFVYKLGFHLLTGQASTSGTTHSSPWQLSSGWCTCRSFGTTWPPAYCVRASLTRRCRPFAALATLDDRR